MKVDKMHTKDRSDAVVRLADADEILDDGDDD